MINWIFFVSAAFAAPKITPYQRNLQACLPNMAVAKIDGHKKLYQALELNHALISSETIYREVLYRQKNELKKLKFEDGIISIFAVDDEGGLKFLNSEKAGDRANNELRHKPLAADARIQQLLIRANIRSDFYKSKETRAGGLTLNLNWADNQIKGLEIEFSQSKKTLNCTQKDALDICTCRG